MSFPFLACFAAYILVTRLMVAHLRGAPRDILFALLNVTVFFFVTSGHHYYLSLEYLPLVLMCYATMHRFADRGDWKPWLAFFTPIGVLIFVRYIFPAAYNAFHKPADPVTSYEVPEFLGISYLTFRNSHLVLQIRNGIVKKPGCWGYLGYSFFLPTAFVGPINPYSNFSRGLAATPPAFRGGRRRGCV